ncbi:GNAT family protein [Xenophilus arseniciresistens]|uniref:GNAT family protein n=1 Tax=Xenophilus arseniciresistens TaxID=1283306 RepID=A0AAE3NB44_9BURK|nr:GNAT family protein [Xenophilus arseniciresistens]MDA7418248.1 GNAT family protein [Xenophilus arseniciresistens]
MYVNPALPAGLTIRTASPADFNALHAARDEVAREKLYLSMFQAPPLEQAIRFFQNSLDKNHPLKLLVRDNQEVLGWCEISGVHGDMRAHIGMLGTGLVAPMRDQGLGGALMQAAIDAAWARGFTRIQLSVRMDNLRAIRLYERLGFEREGVQRKGGLVDGVYHDLLTMALLREPLPAP